MSDRITPDNVSKVKASDSKEEDIVEVKPQDPQEEDNQNTEEASPILSENPEKSYLVPKEMIIQAPVGDAYKENTDMKRHHMKKILDAQPKVMTMIPPDGDPTKVDYHYVCINGYPLWIMKGIFVEVPQQVAELIKESFKLTYAAGREMLADSSPEKLQARLA